MKEIERKRAEAEWAARRCECGADDACAFAQERDEARAERDALIGAGCSAEQNVLALLDLYAERERHATTERDEAVEALESLEAAILELLPYRYNDGTDDEADPGECVGYAAEELAKLRKKVAAASALEAAVATSASVEAQLRQERDEARGEAAELRSALRWYVENDSTQEGGHWEVHCATELRHKRAAMRLLQTADQADDDITAELIAALGRAEGEIQRMWIMLRAAWGEASTAKLAHTRALIQRVQAQALLREVLDLLPDGALRARVEANLEPNTTEAQEDA